MESTLRHKDPDPPHFIDHSLLPTDLMDLMDQTGVVSATNLTTSSSSTYKDALTPDLSFHSTIFQFVNKHVDNVVDEQQEHSIAHARVSPHTGGAAIVGVVPTTADNFEHNKHATDFLSLNNSFLTESHHNVADNNAGVPVTTFPAHAIEPTVPLLQQDPSTLNAAEDELVYVPNARKVLPHKKRISRKLKGAMNGSDSLNGDMTTVYDIEPKRVLYNCEICGYAAGAQLEFFAHLKQHYEPSNNHTILASMKTTLDSLDEENKVTTTTTMSPNQQHQDTDKLEQVFQDVQLHFDDFPNVPSDTMENLKFDDGNNARSEPVVSGTGFVSNTNELSLKNVGNSASVAVDDLEFSDSEDMLEGMRNVVDKLSVEDTCDNIDLVATNDMRAPWFGSSNFSDLAFRSCDDTFAAPAFRQLLLPDETQTPTAPTADVHVTTSTANMALNANSEQLTFLTESTEECMPPPPPLPPTAQLAIHPETHTNLHTMSPTQPLPPPVQTQVPPSMQRDRAEDIFDDDFIEDDSLDSTDDGKLHSNDSDNEENSNKKTFRCEKCAREFNSHNALKYHKRTHTQYRPHQCDTCGSHFYALSALKSHLRTHTDERPFECTHCNRKFRQYGDLRYHKESLHSDSKVHMCEYCGKSFARKYSLDLHRKIHTSERNFRCDYCTKTFRASSYLQSHMRVHTGEKPYTCQICGKKFRASSDRRRHTLIHERAMNAQTKQLVAELSAETKNKTQQD